MSDALLNGDLPPCPLSTPAAETSLIIGSNLSNICYGIMVFLGFRCFNALRRQTARKQTPRTRIGLMSWVLITVIVGTMAQAWDIATVTEIILGGCAGVTFWDYPYLPGVYSTWLIMNFITDGLLVWRCYAIAVGFKRRWLFAWLVPLTIYIVMIGIGIAGVSNYNSSLALAEILLAIIAGISLLLNVIISSSIVLLLLHHKNMLTRACGEESGKPYLNLITILVESASLIILSDALSLAALMARSTVLFIPIQTWAQIQAIAALAIIYQVARGVDYFSNRDSDDVASHTVRLQSSPQTSVLDVKPEGV
ncbi:hypothetical protein D9756_010247 [Leucocoprinus leucothites]|uniref:Uncharacterized protein n=1 Tax=Leucocoprinus leucothites TaxID=201217 RepID=A0A8H5CW39_9AGAR|nr:hypothetical protein D9756_010247 [Leucoagaricus leucothites]